MNQAELDRLVAQIGEEILARVPAAAAKKGEGLNLPDQVCPGCVQRCPQTCAKNTREIIAAGASRVSARPGERMPASGRRRRGAAAPAPGSRGAGRGPPSAAPVPRLLAG